MRNKEKVHRFLHRGKPPFLQHRVQNRPENNFKSTACTCLFPLDHNNLVELYDYDYAYDRYVASENQELCEASCGQELEIHFADCAMKKVKMLPI